MDERIKNLVIIVLGVLCFLLIIGTISSCSGAYRQKLARDKEMAGRLDLEEKMSKYSQERVAMEERVKSKDKDLQEATSELAGVKKELLEEQMISKSLKDDLAKLTKTKESLEEDLKQCKSRKR
ncbi:MAG: hypothetical protein NT060_04205 [Candidatus Omnitrophica bacterium]|nr:hypothetical protein [Candidatus Omnitrophota bacterium]